MDINLKPNICEKEHCWNTPCVTPFNKKIDIKWYCRKHYLLARRSRSDEISKKIGKNKMKIHLKHPLIDSHVWCSLNIVFKEDNHTTDKKKVTCGRCLDIIRRKKED